MKKIGIALRTGLERFASAFSGAGNNTVKLDADFKTSKRNLMWISAAALVLSFLSSTNSSEANCANTAATCGDVAFTLFAKASLPIGFLSLGVLLYLAYLWWAFWRDSRRILISNSPAGLEPTVAGESDTTSVETDFRRVLDDFNAALTKVTEQISESENELKQFPRNVSDVNGLNHDILDFTGRAEGAVNEMVETLNYLGKAMKFPQEKLDDWQHKALEEMRNRANNRKFSIEEFNAELIKVERSVKLIGTLPSIEQLEKVSLNIDGMRALLGTAKDEMAFISKQYTTFSRDLHGADLRDHYILDRTMPNLLAAAAFGFLIWNKGGCILSDIFLSAT